MISIILSVFKCFNATFTFAVYSTVSVSKIERNLNFNISIQQAYGSIFIIQEYSKRHCTVNHISISIVASLRGLTSSYKDNQSFYRNIRLHSSIANLYFALKKQPSCLLHRIRLQATLLNQP